jgi:hypothetical protein
MVQSQSGQSRPYLKKNPSQESADGVAQGIGPEFKPQYHKKKTLLNHEYFAKKI